MSKGKIYSGGTFTVPISGNYTMSIDGPVLSDRSGWSIFDETGDLKKVGTPPSSELSRMAELNLEANTKIIEQKEHIEHLEFELAELTKLLEGK